MRKKKDSTATPWSDPDDAPELTADMLARADLYKGDTLVRRGRGRPRVARPKQQVTLRLDADLIAAIRATGPGWSGMVENVLQRSVRAGHFVEQRPKSDHPVQKTGAPRRPSTAKKRA